MTETYFDPNLIDDLATLGEGAPPITPEHWEMLPATQETYEDRLVEAKRGLMQFETETAALRKAVFDLEIKDQETAAKASELKAVAQKISKRIDGRVKERVSTDEIQAVLNYIQAVKNFGANLKPPLLEAKMEADRKLSIRAEYERQERAKQAKEAQEAKDKLQAQLNKSAEKKGIVAVDLPDPIFPPARTVFRTDTGTTFEMRKWKHRVTDPDKVDRRYCSPDDVKIREAVAGGMRNPDMAGVDVFEHIQMVTRTV